MLTVQEARQLDTLSLGSAVASPASSSAGSRVARSRGYGLEFHDFRRYQPGDDPRSIDWTIHARLQQLVVRVYRSDAHLRVHLLVDTSGSMGAGTPEKLSSATKIAAVLCYIALRQRDAVGIATFDGTIRQHVAPAAGRPQMQRIFDVLAAASAGGQSAATAALTNYGAAVRGPGLAVVISDFFEKDGVFEGLRFLLHRGLTPAVVQVVAPEEIDPSIDEEVEIVDIENPDAPPLVVDARDVKAYRERMARISVDLGEFCITHGLPWMRVESSFGFSRLLDACVHAGLLAGQGQGR